MLEKEQMELFSEVNTERVNRQKNTDMFVVIGNPPYNMLQINENDNNKNRPYKSMDARIKETYVADSNATLKVALYDPYVKAIRWASDRIGDEGIVAFVTNNSYIDGIAFDGMRKHLARDFTKIYHINCKGDARTSGERRRKEGGNVFDDQIRVGIGITFFIKKKNDTNEIADIGIYSVSDYLKAGEKQKLLVDNRNYTKMPLKEAKVDTRHIWITDGLHDEFDDFISIGSKRAKADNSNDSEVIFKSYCRGIGSGRDAWVYNFNSGNTCKKCRTINKEIQIGS